jgi:transcriptional regulator with XRE-family HTH domain
MNIRQIVSANLRQHRKARGLTQQELADKIGKSEKSVSDYEVGRTTPSYATIEKIAEALGIPEAALFAVGVSIYPSGPRAKLLHRINAALSNLNQVQLARAAKVLEALAGS